MLDFNRTRSLGFCEQFAKRPHLFVQFEVARQQMNEK